MGQWRPVLNMLRGEYAVDHPEQANKVVILIEGKGFGAVVANPAEIFSTGEAVVDAHGDWDSI